MQNQAQQHQAQQHQLQLKEGQILSWTADHVQLLSVHAGLVWLTVSNDSFDYWLSPGMQLHLPPAQKVVVESWGTSSTLHLQSVQINSAEMPSASMNNQPGVAKAGELACR
ncbi:DUF2917 domain-containing protein [Undibacterium rugosum]|uniref:DUF2917 domain-containing protein n=1 Tax=Undibacterium rugosum TaxID=2762291 RepID=A0A923L021_9BURK|nr:DUF2917 domain-containing protein [Undibacterium rugosum]MBC3936096.1 DUF2917 domain-containing protein [Undibacterium rugosum]MBR7779269.1 DUF2917 domain-containing protein [Undibacterium rugosum]